MTNDLTAIRSGLNERTMTYRQIRDAAESLVSEVESLRQRVQELEDATNEAIDAIESVRVSVAKRYPSNLASDQPPGSAAEQQRSAICAVLRGSEALRLAVGRLYNDGQLPGVS